MKSFNYTIKDELGIHARPAGMLMKEALKWQSDIYIDNGEKRVSAKKVMAVMSLGAGKGDTVTVSAEGVDEEEACTDMEKFFRTNL